MLPFHKILCPVDFSDPAARALSVSQEIARRYEAELHVLHVVPPVPLVELPPGSGTAAFDVKQYESELIGSFRENLNKTIVAMIGPGIEVAQHLEIGDPAHEIILKAEELECDLIVIATHGRTGLRRFFFGSVAEAVVRRSPCAVLTIPAHDLTT
ncbi:MAG: universal stress protein [Calditrichaeota bacterium]|nr:universal stress protein [Calditrichota bacterium]